MNATGTLGDDLESTIDDTLVSRFRSGETSVYNEIVARHWGRTYATVNRLLKNPEDAEEITQDTFVRVHRALFHFRGESKFSTWLLTIAMNLARNRYWYWMRRKRDCSIALDSPVSAGNDLTLADVIPGEGAAPGDEAVTQEFIDRVSECMKKLPESSRRILELRNIEERSYEEIARTLNLNVGTVKSRIARSREQLRKLLGQEFHRASTGSIQVQGSS